MAVFARPLKTRYSLTISSQVLSVSIVHEEEVVDCELLDFVLLLLLLFVVCWLVDLVILFCGITLVQPAAAEEFLNGEGCVGCDEDDEAIWFEE